MPSSAAGACPAVARQQRISTTTSQPSRRPACGSFGVQSGQQRPLGVICLAPEELAATGLDLDAQALSDFVERVWRMGREHERAGLPWRGIDDAYGVYISEAMLQQTQVARVGKYWPRWMSTFPTIDALSSASTADVLDAWQGLGYNRRALNLKRTADICCEQHEGALPSTVDELVKLPGIGPATAAGIVAFAYQRPSVYIETNVRAVFIHEFFADAQGKVSDRQIEPLVRATCSEEDPRGWYYALLDYGAHLKAVHANPARKAAAYTRQSAFEGSHRQKRSALLREVLGANGVSEEAAKRALDDMEVKAGREALAPGDFEALVAELAAEGFFRRENGLLLP